METSFHRSFKRSPLNHLTIISGNVRSLRNKIDELQTLLVADEVDVVAITESWITAEVLDAEISIEGYNIFRCDRSPNRIGGGVILYCKSSLYPVLVKAKRDDAGTEKFLSFRIKHQDGHSEIAVAYRSPTSKGDLILKEISRVARNIDCIIMGDFNAPAIDWQELRVFSGPESFDHKLLVTAISNNISQSIKIPTRIIPGQPSHTLDLLFTHRDDEITEITPMEPLGSSDHILMKAKWIRRQVNVSSNAVRRNVWKADIEGMKLAAADLSWGNYTELNTDELCELVTTNIHRLQAQFSPLYSKQPRRSPPWFDRELRSQLKKRRKLWGIFKRSSNPADYDNYKQCRNICSVLKYRKRCNYENDLAQSSVSAPKKLFAYLRRKTRAGNGIPSLRNPVTKDLMEDDSDKAASLCMQYSSVFVQEGGTCETLPSATDSSLNDCPFTSLDVSNVLQNLDEQSAPGPDDLHPRILKHLAPYICDPIAELFRKSLNAGKLPIAWKSAVVKPMFKGGTPDDAANYRPVSLTSVLCKTMERILKQNIDNHFRYAGLWNDAKHGFTKGRSCTTNLLLTKEMWAEILDTGGRLDVAFVDFSKAFDRVPHQRLLAKLSAYGIRGNLHEWIKDFVTGRTMQVKVNDQLSVPVECFSGVPQGSVLGPVLFKVYINDLPQNITVSCLLYADDLKLWRHIETDEDVDNLQSALDALDSWCQKWMLPINASKCSVLPVGGKQPFGVYHLGGNLLKEVEVERDLGILISSDFKSDDESKRKAIAASKIMWSIRRSFVRLTPQIFRTLYISHIRPILEYGQPAFHPSTNQEKLWLENVQRKGSKAVTGFRTTAYPERLKTLGLFPLEYRRCRGDLLYTWKILRGDFGEDLRRFFHVTTGSTTRGHGLKIFKPRRIRTNNIVSLSSRVVNVWNKLPNGVILSDNFELFKKRIDAFLMEGPKASFLLDCCSETSMWPGL